MRLSLYHVLALAAIMSSSTHAYTPSSRRTFLTRAVTVGATFAAATLPAHAADDQKQQAEDKQAEKRRKEAEKEARRQAEETKKRLAVGRIGTI